MTKQIIINLYLSGIIVLIGAIIINIIAKYLKLASWYDFINLIGSQGLKQAFVSQGILGFIFLFIIYPLLLGLLVWLSIKFLF